MKLICPNCQSQIGSEHVNVATDLAKCGNCGELFKASDLVADVDLEQDLQPPAGSAIVFQSEGKGVGTFSIPKSGIKGKDIFIFIFAGFWICFIAAWTCGAAFAGGPFALFSIPFWIVGIGMWRGILIGITETQQLRLGPVTLSIFKKSVVSSKHIEIAHCDIASIDMKPFIPRDPFTMARYLRHFLHTQGAWGGVPLATIAHGTKKTLFAENVSEAEAEWLIKMLKAVIAKQAGRKV
jgi:hypothetical protein